jgi:hypothetical protein
VPVNPEDCTKGMPRGHRSSLQTDSLHTGIGTETQDMEAPANLKVRSVPDLVRKEGLAMLVCAVVLCLVSALVDAPIEGPADPLGIPPENVRAPWIFVGIQVMLREMSPLIGGIAIPLAVLGLVAVVPLLPIRTGRRRVVASIAFFGACAVVIAMTILGLWR